MIFLPPDLLQLCLQLTCTRLPCSLWRGPACGRASVLCLFSPHALLPLLLQSSFTLPNHSAVLHAQSEALGACPQMHAPLNPHLLWPASPFLRALFLSCLILYLCVSSHKHTLMMEPLNCLLQNPVGFLPPLWSVRNYPCPHCCVLLIFQNLLKFFSSSGHIYIVIGSFHPLITIVHFIPHPLNLAFTILFSVSLSFFGFVLCILHICEII